MEIQGLSDAQNIYYQHGAPRRTGSSQLRTTTLSRSISNEAEENLESHELQSDNNNNRPRTSPFRLLAENGSGACLPVCKQNGKNNSPLQAQTASVGLRNVNTLKERELNTQLHPQDFLRTGYKYDVESGDSILQMALPFFEGEEEHSQQLQTPVLRQQHEGGASLLQSLASESTAAYRSNTTVSANKNTEELYVVFNIVQDDGNGTNKDRLGNPSKDGDTISGCEKTFITYSALFSHNRTHFRETGQFICTYPGCDKFYDKACRLKIHMRSHTGERPFICDSEACGWSFTSMSKLLRHKRKHDDDRRFTCPEEGCGKSFTRAEHLKGHSITHLGTKPFECHVDGCSAKFSARSSLYIHSKKHKQDAGSLRMRCPVASCSKHFSSRSSLKSHMLKHHHLSPDVLSQLEATPTLTPSSELVSGATATGTSSGVTGSDQLANLDLSSLFSAVLGGPAPTTHGVGVPVGSTRQAGSFAMDLSLVSSGILTIDPASVGTALATSRHGATLAKASMDPLILAAGADMGHLEGTVEGVLPPQGTLNLDDVQTVTPEALSSLTALTMQAATSTVDHRTLTHTLSSSSTLAAEPSPLAVLPGTKLLSSPSKVAEAGGSRGGSGPLLGCVEVLGQQEGGKVLTQFVFPGHGGGCTFGPQKEPELSHSSAVSPCSFLESSGSARTDYRAIQLAKKRKQRGPTACSGSSGLGQRKSKGWKASSTSTPLVPTSARFGEGSTAANGGLTIRDPVTGAQYVQIQLLQDDPASDGDLAFQLSSQPSSSHSQLTVDLPVNILQEPPALTEDDNGSDNSQFTGSTINLQDLE
ncbi:zinc finger protein ZXDC isoform X2 [Coregonus clupeaformis]|uniref:zinc finger protein ZXDC isoform X2 n=1 Tax=Coregonus clupeaformis TaxID=59861 RepID=UPI001BE05C85|nr:zinc finger protein ZXDC isoform X2 [Coregonus clupeaformis]